MVGASVGALVGDVGVAVVGASVGAIRAKFLDRIKRAYDKDAHLVNLMVDPDFKGESI